AEDAAKKMVADFESAYDTTDLWDKTNLATKATLVKMYESGILSKKAFDEISDMYDYYIPLRGFDQTTSDEVYGYLTSGDGSMRGSIMKKAGGRNSLADDPLAWIAAMGEQGISQAHRNIIKQQFLNFVLHNPSDLASVNRLWFEYDDVTDTWNPVLPTYDPKDTAADVERKSVQFEQDMEAKKAADPDKYKRGAEAVDIPYKVLNNNLNEHQILVKRGGETFIITINGNPRVAQAINGMTNPDVKNETAIDAFVDFGQRINRELSAFYTTRNPNFVASNFMRDAMYGNTTVWAKESPKYAMDFNKKSYTIQTESKNYTKTDAVPMPREHFLARCLLLNKQSI
ncbi:MAG: hypothetical protein HUK05_06875, partial [Prevotella sp.]|nr:hypothetical protein [Prevotella sp.]